MNFGGTVTNFAAVPRPAFGRAAQHEPASPSATKTQATARYLRAAKTPPSFCRTCRSRAKRFTPS